jgi:hypothetical protein
MSSYTDPQQTRGRPYLGKRRLHIYLSPEALTLLSTKAREAERSLSEQIEACIFAVWPKEDLRRVDFDDLPDCTPYSRRARPPTAPPVFDVAPGDVVKSQLEPATKPRSHYQKAGATIDFNVTECIERMHALALAKEPERLACEAEKRQRQLGQDEARGKEEEAKRERNREAAQRFAEEHATLPAELPRPTQPIIVDPAAAAAAERAYQAGLAWSRGKEAGWQEARQPKQKEDK